jgi:hypothetical protein
MKLQATLLALAIGALFSTAALADESDINSTWTLNNTVDVHGNVTVSGAIRVDSESAAAAEQDQFTLLNLLFGDGDQNASAGGDALRNASGNIGVNIAAGAGNVQANDGALSAIDGSRVFASALVFTSQGTGANIGTDFPAPLLGAGGNLAYHATVGDSVLRSASGNIGVNVAAGTGNAQGNALAASVNTSGNVAKASSESEQAAVLNILAALVDLDDTASLGGDALRGAMGNIGVNIAAGAGNAQHNGLAVATATGP